MDDALWFEWIDAITEGDLARVAGLFAAGIDVNARDERGQSGFSYACAYDSFAAARMLYESGADVNAAYADGGTPLDTASGSASPEFYAWLVAVGARRNWDGEGAAEFAYNEAQPAASAPAVVLSKRTAVVGPSEFGGSEEQTSYFVTFDVGPGRRREFGVGPAEYARLAEGERGTLRHRGYRYLGFDRAGP